MSSLENKSDNKDIFTSIVRVKGNDKYRVVPVKSNKEVDKKMWMGLSKVLARIYVSVPIKSGDLICKNILNTGIDIVCTRDINDE